MKISLELDRLLSSFKMKRGLSIEEMQELLALTVQLARQVEQLDPVTRVPGIKM